MEHFNRRSLLLGGAAALTGAGLAATTRVAAHSTPAATGSWSPLTQMPFPVQEIYPAPFWRETGAAKSLKPQPFNIIVNAGGLTPDEPYEVTNKVTYYDPLYDAWGYGTPVPEPRHHLALVNNNGYLYGVGGFARNQNGGWQMRGNLWRSGDIDGPWLRLRPMPHPQAETVCASLAGFLHVVGGRAPAGSANARWEDHIDTDEHWLYDAAADQWFALAPMLTARNSAAGAVVNGFLYVVGGRTVDDGNSAVVEVYDPLSDRWSKARPMPKAQGGLAAGIINGRIYAFGGEYFGSRAGNGGVYAEAWEYDPDADHWRAVAAMPRRRHGLGAVSMDNAIYVMGGAAQVGGVATSAALDKFEI